MKFQTSVRVVLMATIAVLAFVCASEKEADAARCRIIDGQMVCDGNYGQQYTPYRSLPSRTVHVVRSAVPMERASNRTVTRRGLFGRRAAVRSVSRFSSNGSSGSYQSYGSRGSYNAYALPTSYVEEVEVVETQPEAPAVPDAVGPDNTGKTSSNSASVETRLAAIEARLTTIEEDLLIQSLQRSEADRKSISLNTSLVQALVRADNDRFTVARR